MSIQTTNGGVTLTRQTLTIPTYATAKPEKNPMFLENRAYQGSTGKVYPFPVTERVFDEKHDQDYQAVILENDYIQVTFLPQLGGRIQRMLDKTNHYDFVYYNQVIKPALVGLAGSWISGGIEFNWPQHHRPDTFLPINYYTEDHKDGSKTLWISDVDRMYGTKILVGFTMFPDKAYLKIDETFSNPTDLPQTFLWWANPAVPVNDHTQSIFPPDVHAVFDHGKRAVSDFPIATGEYYKVDYSAGVDISRYKNVPVPTSYMAAHSNYNFLGNYDHQKQAGLLHVADHHTSPGKKQWTWGNGDFGQSWDHQLTDENGPYIELMVGTFTDNQPDFTWLNPHEEKHATEYFMPYKAVGAVKNATIHAAVNLEKNAEQVTVAAYTTSAYPGAHVILTAKGKKVYDQVVDLSPTATFKDVQENVSGTAQDLTVTVTDATGNTLVTYTPDADKIEKIPDAATAIAAPEKLQTNDELYFAGQHLEQYRHASFRPETYYLEGLKRDPGDKRLNDAYGELLYRQGLFAASEPYFCKALARQNQHNTNPVSGSASYHLGLSLVKQGKLDAAYDAFYKATWSGDTQAVSFLALAKIKLAQGSLTEALHFTDESLLRNYHDLTARTLKAHILRQLGQNEQAQTVLTESLALDASEPGLLYEQAQLSQAAADQAKLTHYIGGRLNDVLALAELYLTTAQYQDAIAVLERYAGQQPLQAYYLAYAYAKLGQSETALQHAQAGAKLSPDYVFPNRLFDVVVLDFIQTINPEDGYAPYYLGNFYYDKRIYDKAVVLWEKAVALAPAYAMPYRNLSIAYYNKQHQSDKALAYLEKAFKLDPTNARLVFELDSLYQKFNRPLPERLAFLQAHQDLVAQRDDSYVALVTLLNETGQYQAAYDALMAHIFHPWEGGEGKVSTQYEYALIELAKADLQAGAYQAAVDKLQKALVYPRSLGEGKLPIAHDDIIDFYLGYAYKQLGDQAHATQYLQQATVGLTEPTDMMYYNDQPADTIFYQGLAYEQLGQPEKAVAKYHKLVSFGEKQIFNKFVMDYFAVSLPDALLFDEDYQQRNSVHCYYLMALGYLGLNETDKAQAMFMKATALTNSHQGVLRHAAFVKPEV
ncbi:DUF5107 domain-containing protein [Loigolactobacillus bifermentans]|uniref:DUF5107 domain-containing protein n=1 Tax=Loigolactobacillus bifermentans TaxID=1607 RepID=UPI00070B8FBE|nr:DUF5107 domain-containing protein [Loigolactobacillus bifermentans]QGG61119.1 DUF5107 domain-containing protein [Loigolactobacillus bifermentans]